MAPKQTNPLTDPRFLNVPRQFLKFQPEKPGPFTQLMLEQKRKGTKVSDDVKKVLSEPSLQVVTPSLNVDKNQVVHSSHSIILGGRNNSSFILMNHDNIMEAASATATGTAFGSITSVEASAPEGDVDIEIFVAVDGPNTTV